MVNSPLGSYDHSQEEMHMRSHSWITRTVFSATTGNTGGGLIHIMPLYDSEVSYQTVAGSRHWSLSWATLIQSISFQPASLRSNLTLPLHLRLGLLSGLFSSPHSTKILYVFLIFPRVLHAVPISSLHSENVTSVMLIYCILPHEYCVGHNPLFEVYLT